MNEIHPMMDSTDKKFGPQLMIGGRAHVMWLWMTDDTTADEDRDPDAYQLQLSPIELKGLTYTNGGVAKTKDGTFCSEGVSQWRVDNQHDGDVFKLFDSFLAKVNKYIDDFSVEEDDMVEDAGFPKEGTLTEQVLWLLTNGVAVVEGKVVRK